MACSTYMHTCRHSWDCVVFCQNNSPASATRRLLLPLCFVLLDAFLPTPQANGEAPKARGVLGSFVSKLALRVVGSSALTAEDLAPALADMKVWGRLTD